MDIGEAAKRLSFIKYLFKVSVEQTEKPEPLCWASMLTFHDAVELFLQLSAEYVNSKEKLSDIHFLDYWRVINTCLKRLGDKELTQIISMERLNKARVNFKHYGTPPSKSAITGDFKISVTNFFEENTLIVFGIKFSEISMFDIITYAKTRDNLKRAEELLKENKQEDSLDLVAVAFEELINDYLKTKTTKLGISPFSISRSHRHFSAFFMGLKGDLGDFIDWTRESFESIERIIRIIGLGIDYKKYIKFKFITPYVLLTTPPNIQRKDRAVFGQITNEDVEFCINFVVESALILQEFDYSFSHKENHETL